MNWIDVNDSMPDIKDAEHSNYDSTHQQVIVVDEYGDTEEGRYNFDESTFETMAIEGSDIYWRTDTGVTHWMPWPDPPVVKEGVGLTCNTEMIPLRCFPKDYGKDMEKSKACDSIAQKICSFRPDLTVEVVICRTGIDEGALLRNLAFAREGLQLDFDDVKES